jgi:hypothetical protein
MDVLTRFRSGRLAAAVLVSAWIVATACLSFPRTRSEPSFPHRVHVVDNQLACTFCHGSVRVSDDPSLPPPELCATCHAQFDGDKPRERRLAAFFDEGGRYRRVAVSGRTEDVVFSHRAHAKAEGFDCTVCHSDAAAQDSVPLEPLMVKAQCMPATSSVASAPPAPTATARSTARGCRRRTDRSGCGCTGRGCRGHTRTRPTVPASTGVRCATSMA